MLAFYCTLLLLTIPVQNTALYSPLQIFKEPENVTNMISISDENEIFIAGGNDNKVHVYLNNGDSFTNGDSSFSTSDDLNVAKITGNGKWILTVDELRYA